MRCVGYADVGISELDIMLAWVANGAGSTAMRGVDLDRPVKISIADCHKPPIKRNCVSHRA